MEKSFKLSDNGGMLPGEHTKSAGMCDKIVVGMIAVAARKIP